MAKAAVYDRFRVREAQLNAPFDNLRGETLAFARVARSATSPSGAYSLTTRRARLAPPHPGSIVILLAEVVRDALPHTDNHVEGEHVNVLWLDGTSRQLGRYDPYFYAGDADCAGMQAVLDVAAARVAPEGWTLAPGPSAAFGPEFVEASADGPRGHGEEFCHLWAIEWGAAALRARAASEPITVDACLASSLASLGLAAPSDAADALRLAPDYLRAIRGVAARVEMEPESEPEAEAEPARQRGGRGSKRRRRRRGGGGGGKAVDLGSGGWRVAAGAVLERAAAAAHH